MPRSYVKVECLAEEVLRRKAVGETNRDIGEHFGLSGKQIKRLATRQRRKQRMIENGYEPRPKRRPRKMVYMCAGVDLCGKMVLSYRIGNDMTTTLVTDTIREARQKEMVTDGLALHSDQGSQYTSQAYFDLMQAYHFERINLNDGLTPFEIRSKAA